MQKDPAALSAKEQERITKLGSKRLYKAVKKYGWEAFEIAALKLLPIGADSSIILPYENAYLAARPYYNDITYEEGRLEHSIETRAKMRASRLANPKPYVEASPEAKARKLELVGIPVYFYGPDKKYEDYLPSRRHVEREHGLQRVTLTKLILFGELYKGRYYSYTKSDYFVAPDVAPRLGRIRSRIYVLVTNRETNQSYQAKSCSDAASYLTAQGVTVSESTVWRAISGKRDPNFYDFKVERDLSMH
jgi:hypothetical protein